jgi:hypothetical protein
MANATGMIRESIWRDGDWRLLSRSAQALYMQLISQKEIDCAGVLPLQPNKWAKGCADLTVEQVWVGLNELQENRFVLYDTDTDEAFVRSYVRNSNVLKVPNMRKSAGRSALLVGSQRIRAVLAEELRATGSPDLLPIADQINPSERVTERVTQTLTQTLPKQSKTTLSKPLPEPIPEPTGVGMGTGTGVTHLGNNSSGGERPHCAKHPQGNPDDDPCRGCQRTRKWDEDHAANIEADELENRRRQRDIADNCPDCHGTNLIEVDDNAARKCEHPYATKEATHA